jgi:HEAT repeat protein
MSERYEPPSEFLKAIIAEEVPIGTTGLAAENLSRLISMTFDQDSTNRDWATMLLAQEQIDTENVRSALLRAVRDDYEAVRAEALLGLAKIDPKLALPYAIEALAGDSASMPVFEAAEMIANPALIPALQPWLYGSENSFVDDWAQLALQACVRGASKFR